MLLVKTKIGLSEINGIGLFSVQFIPKDTLIWKFQSGFDQSFDKDELNNLSEPAKGQFLKYAYLSRKTNKYILCFDDARFFNHSKKPNCISIESQDYIEVINVATEDISEGEELTCDYEEFDAEFDEYRIDLL